MPHTLLLADDSLAIQRVVELTFAGEDIRVVAVGDGRQAMAHVAADRPDIVLVDIAMPAADGYAVAEFVRMRPETRDVPVLLLAGAFDRVEPARLDASGAAGVLMKPFEPHAVISRVKELLGMEPPRGAARGAPAARLVTPAEPVRPPRTLVPDAPAEMSSEPDPAAGASGQEAALDPAVMAALVDRLAAKMLEDAALRDKVTARVLEVSERLVREEIARLRADAESDAT